MATWIVFRHGWNSANQPCSGCRHREKVAKVRADTAEEACRKAAALVTVYNNQHLSAELRSEVRAREAAEREGVELLEAAGEPHVCDCGCTPPHRTPGECRRNRSATVVYMRSLHGGV